MTGLYFITGYCVKSTNIKQWKNVTGSADWPLSVFQIFPRERRDVLYPGAAVHADRGERDGLRAAGHGLGLRPQQRQGHDGRRIHDAVARRLRRGSGQIQVVI